MILPLMGFSSQFQPILGDSLLPELQQLFGPIQGGSLSSKQVEGDLPLFAYFSWGPSPSHCELQSIFRKPHMGNLPTTNYVTSFVTESITLFCPWIQTIRQELPSCNEKLRFHQLFFFWIFAHHKIWIRLYRVPQDLHCVRAFFTCNFPHIFLGIPSGLHVYGTRHIAR